MSARKYGTVGVASVAAAVAVAVGGCGSTAKTGGSGEPTASAAAIKRAADASDAAEGFTFKTTIHETIPGSGAAEIEGAGVFSRANHGGTITQIPKGATQAMTSTITMFIADYGPQPTPTPPPADETTDLLALLQAAGQTNALTGS
jgi:hypothetical protein